MKCLPTYAIASTKRRVPQLSSNMFQILDSSFQMESPKLLFCKDADVGFRRGACPTPNLLISDAILEPTPFQEGTSLQPASDSATMYKPSQSVHQPPKSNEVSTWTGLLAYMEKVSSSPDSPTKNLKRPVSSQSDEEECPRLTKRPRTASDDMSLGPKLRPHQDALWHEHFSALVQFKNKYGHCRVHYTCGHDEALSKWAQRQRYQYTLKTAGKKNTMTDERQQKLEALGFSWDSHAASWQQRFNELAEYKKKHGDCKVPSSFRPNPQLAMWVKSQRRQYKLYRNDQSSNLSQDRLEALNQIGFAWELRAP